MSITITLNDNLRRALEKLKRPTESYEEVIASLVEKGDTEFSDLEEKTVLADVGALSESWLSEEDEKAFAYLQ